MPVDSPKKHIQHEADLFTLTDESFSCETPSADRGTVQVGLVRTHRVPEVRTALLREGRTVQYSNVLVQVISRLLSAVDNQRKYPM